MGAVFALFAGFYYWIGKMSGYEYPEFWGKVHFYVLFIGVNLTFFVQHFLGLSGFPRRYPDYPDAYSGWNYISSFGSIVSLVGVIVFVYVLYRTFADRQVVSANYWKAPELFEQVGDTNTVTTLEWIQNSPPVLHTYNETPYITATTSR